MEIIDTHVHLNDDESFRHTNDLERAAGVAWMVVSCLAPYDGVYRPTPEQFRENNARVHEWMKREAGFVRGWAYVNPEHQQESLDEIDRAVNEYGMSGVELECGCVCTDRRYGAIIKKAARLGVPVLQHAWFKITGCIPGESMPLDVAAAGAISRFPGAAFVISEVTYAELLAVKQPLDGHGNWSFDIGTMQGRHDNPDPVEVVVRALDDFGAEKMLFGSNAPFQYVRSSLLKVLRAPISESDKDLILSGNAMRLLADGRGIEDN